MKIKKKIKILSYILFLALALFSFGGLKNNVKASESNILQSYDITYTDGAPNPFFMFPPAASNNVYAKDFANMYYEIFNFNELATLQEQSKVHFQGFLMTTNDYNFDKPQNSNGYDWSYNLFNGNKSFVESKVVSVGNLSEIEVNLHEFEESPKPYNKLFYKFVFDTKKDDDPIKLNWKVLDKDFGYVDISEYRYILFSLNEASEIDPTLPEEEQYLETVNPYILVFNNLAVVNSDLYLRQSDSRFKLWLNENDDMCERIFLPKNFLKDSFDSDSFPLFKGQSSISSNQAPVFSGETNYLVNVDDLITEQGIRSQLSAVDEVDGTVEIKLVEDNYTGFDLSKIDYNNQSTTIKYSATDKSNNTAYLTVNIQFYDITKPNAKNGLTSIDFDVPWGNSSGLRDYVESNIDFSSYFEDNLASPNELIIENDIENKSISDYSANFLNFTLYVRDKFYNKLEFPLNLNIKYLGKPKLIIEQNSFATPYGSNLKIEDLLDQIKTYDAYDSAKSKETSIEIQANNYDNSKIGVYEVNLKAVNSLGVKSDPYKITINVNDQLPPIFMATSNFIKTNEFVELTLQDIIIILEITGKIPPKSNQADYSFNTNYENKPGTYYMNLNNKSTGEQINLNILNTSSNESEGDNPNSTQVRESVQYKMRKFFKKNWIFFAIGGGALITIPIITAVFGKKNRRR